jgi:chromosomal replication initiator protein
MPLSLRVENRLGITSAAPSLPCYSWPPPGQASLHCVDNFVDNFPLCGAGKVSSLLSPAAQEAWSRILEELRRRVSDQKFQTWFHPIRPIEVSSNRVVLEVPNPFFVDWFEEHNLPLLRSAVSTQLPGGPEIRFTVADGYQNDFQRATHLPVERPPTTVGNRSVNLLVSSNLKPQFTFENFVVGRGNEFTYAACRAVAQDPARVYNPLFIYGGVGLGKTHIMQAIGFEVKQRTPTAKVHYVSSERFMNEMIESIQRGTTLDFRERYRGLDLLLIDDIQFMSGKESTQEEFFHTFNSLYDSNKQVVVTSDRAPKDIPDLEERLISRFNWGLVTDIQPPDLETRVAILRRKAERSGVEIPDAVLFFIAENIRSNIRELEGSLVRLSALASLTGTTLTTDLAREVLGDYIRGQQQRSPDVLEIQKAVAAHFELPVETLRGKRRTSSVALGRQVAMYLTKQLTSLTLVEIGRRFGNRDHSTVLYACSRVAERAATEPSFSQILDRIRHSLLNQRDQSDQGGG